ncbi:MAG: SEL1-like repeat protein [Planctomycetaceae bacterium]|nr:SEL1-like repeat protein [Planctomycetales bacterium]MCB9923045.1 SEL1-like repeat protein [Planctomycetaceae bacterium]
MNHLRHLSLAVWLTITLVACSVNIELMAQPPTTPRGATPSGGTAALPPRVYGKVHALCIGINRYRASTITTLKWAEADAEKMSQVFADRYGYDIELLTGHRASRDRILESLTKLCNGLGPDDGLILFFAGHGQTVELEEFGSAGYLLPFDAALDPSDTRDTEQWNDEAIDMREIGELVTGSRARHVLVLADVCYSGFLGKRSSFGGRVDLEQLAQRKSRVAITAGTEKQVAFEREELGHGLFTHFLLEQLDVEWPGSASELFVNVRNGVAKMSNGQMLPQYREIVVDNGEFVFLPKQVASQDVKEAVVEVSQRISKRVARATMLADLYQAASTQGYRGAADVSRHEREWQGRVKRFEDNATLGDPLAMAALYYCCKHGLGMPIDPPQAFQWATVANATNHPAGKHVLGDAYESGTGVAINPIAGRKLIQVAAQAEFMLSEVELAIRSLQSQPARDQIQHDVAQLEAGVREGISEASVVLGLMLAGIQPGLDDRLDRDRGLVLLKTAAESGAAKAAFILYGVHSGIVPGFQTDITSSTNWLRAAAEGGLAEAQGHLARNIYLYAGQRGVGVGLRLEALRDGFILSEDSRIVLHIQEVLAGGPAESTGKILAGDSIVKISQDGKNFVEIESQQHGFELLSGAAGSTVTLRLKRDKEFEVMVTRASYTVPRSELWISTAFSTPPIGGSMDDAVRWATAAAAQGDALANYVLAIMYAWGDGVPRDFEKAKAYCDAAIALNFPAAVTRMGVWHQIGDIVPLNHELALQLFKRASALGDPEACFRQAGSYDNVVGVHLAGYTRMEMKGVYQHHALHWYVQAYNLGYPLARGQLARCDVMWISNDAPVLRGFRAEYPESYKVFRKIRLELGSDPDKWIVGF